MKELLATSQEFFIKSIQKEILIGNLKIGDRLPSERKMAEDMDISKTIINLGLKELSRLGFIEIIPRRGAYVADYVKRGNLSTLLEIINFNNGKLDKKTFNSLMQLRLINEGELAALAAINRTDNDIINIKEKLSMIEKATSAEDKSLAIFEFHHSLVLATQNNIYPLVHTAFQGVSVMLMSIIIKEFPNMNLLDSYSKIYTAIVNKDNVTAKDTIINTINTGIELLEKKYF